MSGMERRVRLLSHKITKVLACRAGDATESLHVCEYPKSGGTWFGKMVADALQMPYPRPAVFPITFPAVIHAHWSYHPRIRRVFYLYRDGRDVLVSLYFHRMRKYKAGDPVTISRFKSVYDRILGAGWDPDDSRANMARFIEREFEHPRDSRIDWVRHVSTWRGDGGHPHVTYLSYEQLLEDCAGTLMSTIESVTGEPLERWRAEMTAEKFSFARQTGGRTAGTEDRASFIRKGVAGDWRNHFTRETAEVFEARAGHVLRDLGYESDSSWVDQAGTFDDRGGDAQA